MQHVSIISIDKANKLIPNQVLNSHEFEYFNKSLSSFRKSDYLAGRIASKMAFLKYNQFADLKKIKVLNEQFGPHKGRPHIYFNNHKLGLISIGHSGDLACALYALDKSPIAIDIEYVTKRDNSFLLYNYTEQEINLIKQFTGQQRNLVITLLWTAKESMSKSIGKGLSLNTKKLEINLNQKKLSTHLIDTYIKIKYQGQYTCNTNQYFNLQSYTTNFNNQLYCITISKLIPNNGEII